MKLGERLDDILDAWAGERFDLGQPLPTTRETCADELMRLDAIIGAIDGQVTVAKLGKIKDPEDIEWLRRAIGALSLHKARRNRVNTHMGTVTTAEKRQTQMRVERAFMTAAMKMLSVDQVRAVFDKAAEIEPSLFTGRDAA